MQQVDDCNQTAQVYIKIDQHTKKTTASKQVDLYSHINRISIKSIK